MPRGLGPWNTTGNDKRGLGQPVARMKRFAAESGDRKGLREILHGLGANRF
jgi:hypothetical protein